MPLSEITRKTAEQMLKKYEYNVPNDLYMRLDRVDQLAKSAGGQLHSRQVIAMVIEQWERDKESLANGHYR